jgi:hypothetical protein
VGAEIHLHVAEHVPDTKPKRMMPVTAITSFLPIEDPRKLGERACATEATSEFYSGGRAPQQRAAAPAGAAADAG